MLFLLNASYAERAMFWMLIILGILLIVEIAGFAILMAVRNRRRSEIVEARRPVSISLDTDVVRRDYGVGDEFDPSGLIVTVHYSDAPYDVALQDFTLVTPELVEQLVHKGKKPEDLSGCLVYVPDLSVAGKPVVTVEFGGQLAAFAINVGDPAAEEPEEAPAPVVEEIKPQRWLVGITLNIINVKREYKVGETLDIEGLIVTGHYNMEPYTEELHDFAVHHPDMNMPGRAIVMVGCEDKMTDYAIYIDEPTPAPAPVVVEKVVEKVVVVERKLVGLTLNTDAVRKSYVAGDELDTTGLVVYGNYNVEPLVEEIKDYEIQPIDMTQVGTPTVLVKHGDIAMGYQITVTPATIVIEEAPEVIRITHDPIVIEEDSYEGRLRYDRSFTARLIQSEDEVKLWYTEIKNYLLGFKKVKDRMSWKRESYRYGREPVVRLGYRGKTLCVFLPLDPNEYLESKYKVEDVSDNSSYVDTPCMYRLKNARRVKYALELIDVVMERFSGGARIEREALDYYVPYEGTLELINKGLIKRNIKTREDEAFFEEKAQEAEAAAADGTSAE